MVITKPSKHVRSHLCLLQPAIAPPQAAFVFSHSRQELCCVPSGRALRQDARSRRRFHPFRVTPQPLALNYNNLSPDELLTLRRLIEKAAGESAGELDGATDERSPARRRRLDGPRPWLHRLRSGQVRLVRRFPRYYGGVRLPAPVHHRLRLLAFPMRARAQCCRWPNAGSPSFRCIPFARDVLFDPGRTAMPRITALLMLRSTISTVSAPATCLFRGSITNPMQLLCTLRGRRYRRLTQHSLPGGPLRPYPDRSFAGWTAPALAGAFRNPG